MKRVPRATIEEWRPTHHAHYDVSNLGRVRSVARGTAKILRPGIASHCYPTVAFGRRGGSQCVHTLVAAAFLGPCPADQECRHKDDCRTNPRLDNLEYGTRKMNVADMMRRNRRTYVLVPRQVRNIKQHLANGVLQKTLAEAYGVNRMTINRINTGKAWSHV